MGHMSTQMQEGKDVPHDTFEARLAMARFHAGHLSAAEAGLRVGVSGQAWRNWEAGHSVGARKPAMMEYIAKQLGVSEKWLREGGPLTPDLDPRPLRRVRREGIEPPTRWFRGNDLTKAGNDLVRAA